MNTSCQPLRQRALRAVASTIVLATVALGMGTSHAQGTQLRVAYLPAVTFLPAMVAMDKGIFQKHGLDVTLTATQNLAVLPTTVGRQFELAPATVPDLLKAVVGGVNIVAVAGEALDTKANPSIFLIARKGSNIKSVKDLGGKVVGVSSVGSVVNLAFQHQLKANGVDPATVRVVLVAVANVIDQMNAGRIDAAQTIQPFAAQMLAAGHVALEDPMLSVGDSVLLSFWIAEGTWAKANAQTIGKWIASLEEASAFIKQNDAEARSILAKYTKLPPAVTNTISMPTYAFSIKPEQFEVWAKLLQEQGVIDKVPNVNPLIVTTK